MRNFRNYNHRCMRSIATMIAVSLPIWASAQVPNSFPDNTYAKEKVEFLGPAFSVFFDASYPGGPKFVSVPTLSFGKELRLFIVNPNTFRYTYGRTFESIDYHNDESFGELEKYLNILSSGKETLASTTVLRQLFEATKTGATDSRPVGAPGLIQKAYDDYESAWNAYLQKVKALAVDKDALRKADPKMGEKLLEVIATGRHNLAIRWEATVLIHKYLQQLNSTDTNGIDLTTLYKAAKWDEHTLANVLDLEPISITSPSFPLPARSKLLRDYNADTRKKLEAISFKLAAPIDTVESDLKAPYQKVLDAEKKFRENMELYYDVFLRGLYQRAPLSAILDSPLPDGVDDLSPAAFTQQTNDSVNILMRFDSAVKTLEDKASSSLAASFVEKNKLDNLQSLHPADDPRISTQRMSYDAALIAYQQAEQIAKTELRKLRFDKDAKPYQSHINTVEKAREFQQSLFFVNFFVTPAFREQFRRRLEKSLAEKRVSDKSAKLTASEVFDIQERLIIEQYELAKTLDERVKHRSSLIEPLHKEQIDNLNGIRSKLNAAGGIYRLILDPIRTPAVIEERVDQVKGDAVEITIQVTPTDLPTLETAKGFKGANAEAPTVTAGKPTVGVIRKTTARVAKRWTFDVGPGVLLTTLTPRKFYMEETEFGNVPRAEGHDSVDLRTGLMFHYYQTQPKGPGLGLTLGAVAESPTQILVAPVVVFGQGNRLALSIGATFGQQERLTGGQRVNQVTGDKTLQTRNTLAVGGFASLTITFHIK